MKFFTGGDGKGGKLIPFDPNMPRKPKKKKFFMSSTPASRNRAIREAGDQGKSQLENAERAVAEQTVRELVETVKSGGIVHLKNAIERLSKEDFNKQYPHLAGEYADGLRARLMSVTDLNDSEVSSNAGFVPELVDITGMVLNELVRLNNEPADRVLFHGWKLESSTLSSALKASRENHLSKLVAAINSNEDEIVLNALARLADNYINLWRYPKARTELAQALEGRVREACGFMDTAFDSSLPAGRRQYMIAKLSIQMLPLLGEEGKKVLAKDWSPLSAQIQTVIDAVREIIEDKPI